MTSLAGVHDLAGERPSRPGEAKRTRLAPSVGRILLPLLVFALVITGWYAVTYLGLEKQRRFLLPAPHAVVKTFFEPQVFTDIMYALGRTAIVALMGLVVATLIGTVWAAAMSQARWLETALHPYAVVLQCVPILAMVPLIGFWFGFGYKARVIVCVIIALFPIVSNTLFGLRSTDSGQRDLFAIQCASRWTRLRKLEFPAALPAIFAGLRISAGMSVVGAIAGDFLFRRGKPGLGSLIGDYQSVLASEKLFAAMMVALLFGVFIFLLFGWLSKIAVGRWYESSER